jgi:hypothetical protein
MRIEKQTPMGTSQLMSVVKGGATVGTGQLFSSRWAASSRATLAFAWMSLACATPLSVISRISAGHFHFRHLVLRQAKRVSHKFRYVGFSGAEQRDFFSGKGDQNETDHSSKRG